MTPKPLSLILSILMLFIGCNLNQVEAQPIPNTDNTNAAPASVYAQGLSLQTLQGTEKIDLSVYKGKKLLVVNLASKCGFTPQYADLQALQEKHGDRIAILGFPSNDFGGQEPGTAAEIASFCQTNYGVSFQLFEKTSVKKGSDQNPLYQWLSDQGANGWNDQAPTWNFCKYLINERGELVKFFASGVKPMDPEILDAIVGGL